MTPTIVADEQAREHLLEIERAAVKPQSLSENVIFNDKLRQLVIDYHVNGAGLPRIYPLQGGYWNRACDLMESTLGYRYSLEHWMHKFLLGNAVTLVDDVDSADYVYLPHCATGVFMHAVARELLTWKTRVQEEQDAAVREFPRQFQMGAAGGDFPADVEKELHALESGSMAEPKRRVRRRQPANATKPKYLVYEGNLPSASVRETDSTYLMLLVQRHWAHSPEAQRCWSRPNCRFLIISCYGRHVWREFAEAFADRAVFVTHSGMSDWVARQPSSLFLGPSAEPGTGCHARCPEHCVLQPASVLEDDLVVPWTVAYQWTRRAHQFSGRNILAFYSGTENSCTRALLRNMFGDEFQAELDFLSWRPAHGRIPRTSRPRDHVLIFPPDFRLLQEDWSEIAFRSRLCIVPDGDSPNTGRLIEVIMHGCVPLIVSDRLQPPLHEYVDWPSIAFFVREEAISTLPELLASLATPQGTRRILAKQRNLEQAAHLFDYGRDALGAVMYFALRDRTGRLGGA